MHEEFDGEEIVYIDFDRKEFVYTVPTYIMPDPTELIGDLLNPKIISRGRNACKVVLAYCIAEEKNPSEEKGKGCTG